MRVSVDIFFLDQTLTLLVCIDFAYRDDVMRSSLTSTYCDYRRLSSYLTDTGHSRRQDTYVRIYREKRSSQPETLQNDQHDQQGNKDLRLRFVVKQRRSVQIKD